MLAQQQPTASIVQIANVSRAEFAPTGAVPGTIYSRNDVQVTVGVTGQLTLDVEPGTFVNMGDSVARIDSPPLVPQRAEQEALLQRAEINVPQLKRQRELISSKFFSEFEIVQPEANGDLAISDANLTKVRIR